MESSIISAKSVDVKLVKKQIYTSVIRVIALITLKFKVIIIKLG